MTWTRAFVFLALVLSVLVSTAGCGRGKSGEGGGSPSPPPPEPPAPKLHLALLADRSACAVGDRIRFSARFVSAVDETLQLILPATREALRTYELVFEGADGKPLAEGVVRERFRRWKPRPVQTSQAFDELRPKYTSILSLSRLFDRTSEVAFTESGTYRVQLVYDTRDKAAIEKRIRETLRERSEDPEALLAALGRVHEDRLVSQKLTIEVKPGEGGKVSAPLRLNLRTTQTAHEVGDEVDLACEFENVSAAPLTLVSPKASGELGGYTLLFGEGIDVLLEKGILKRTVTSFTRELVEPGELFLELEPGERVEVDLSRFIYRDVVYAFEQAGEYAVRLIFDVDDAGALAKRFHDRLASNTEDPENLAEKLRSVHTGRAASNTLTITVGPG
ncbi:MAG: hypothetical protein ACYS47_03990 [Planctomycetota bacterium]|jgi:hypothetical protein